MVAKTADDVKRLASRSTATNSTRFTLRRHLHDVIEHALALLDHLDGDPDLEDGGDDEPSLGSPAGGDSQMAWSAGADHDGELA